jgi:hypothetical protein
MGFCAESPECLEMGEPTTDGMGIDEPATRIRGSGWSHQEQILVARSLAALVFDGVHRRRFGWDDVDRIMGMPEDSAFLDERHGLGAAALLYLTQLSLGESPGVEGLDVSLLLDQAYSQGVKHVGDRPTPPRTSGLSILPEIISWLGILILRLRHVGRIPALS